MGSLLPNTTGGQGPAEHAPAEGFRWAALSQGSPLQQLDERQTTGACMQCDAAQEILQVLAEAGAGAS